MGMGYGANFSIAAQHEDIKKLGLASFDAFQELLDKYQVDINEVAASVQYDQEIEGVTAAADKLIYDAYNLFIQEFKDKTGINIYLAYHSSSDEGDRYDEVDGGYYELDFSDVYQLTKEAEKLKETVPFEMRFFVSFG